MSAEGPPERLAVAPGKAFLTGEYAVLHGAPAWVVAVDRLARARLGGPPPVSPPSPLVAALLDKAGLPPGTPLQVDTSAFSEGGRKLGLGSSAACAAAAALAITGDPTTSLPLALEAHEAAQPGGSGADVWTSHLGGAVRFRRAASPRGERRALPPELTLLFVATAAAADTPSLRARVGERGQKLVPLAEALDEALGERPARPRAIVELVRAYLAEEAALGAGIVTPEHARIAELAVHHGGAAKPSGAGGGDLAVCFLPAPEAAAPLRAALLREGLAPLDLTLAEGAHLAPPRAHTGVPP